MAIYCNKFSDQLMTTIQKIYNSLKNEETVYSFYFDLLFKQTLSYCKAEEIKETKEIIKYAVKQFIENKVKDNELIPRYNIQCISCRKKIYGPISSLDELPETCTCPFCNEQIDFKNDYLYYELRYMFADKRNSHITI